MKLNATRPRLGRIQRKVIAVILVIVVVPMLIAGGISAAWMTHHFELLLEGWIREAAQVNEATLQTLQRDAMVVGDLLAHNLGQDLETQRLTSLTVPPQLMPLVDQLGINLIQLYDEQRRLTYSNVPLQMMTSWAPGQTEAILKVAHEEDTLLAAVAILALPRGGQARNHLVLGSLLDQEFVRRLGQASGLRTRLFYPEGEDYARAFRSDAPALRVRLPPGAYSQLQHRQPYYNRESEEGRYRGLYTPIVDSTGHVEAVFFSGLESPELASLLTNRLMLSVPIVLLGVVIGAVVGLILSRVVVRPIEYLQSGVMHVAAQDFRTEVPITSRDELGDLARAFNAMAASLRQARDAQRREFQKDKLTALGELSLSLAHEIRNPIGVINTASAMLARPEQPPEKQADLMRMIREESLRLNHLLKDFQQLARHRQPEFATINPEAPLEATLRVALAGREDVEVRHALAHGTAMISADPELLRQAWMNLVTNALQAMEGRPMRLLVSTELHDGRVVVALEDSGPGISADLMPRLFEPFYTSKPTGTGLGLTIANTLVEACGGRLEVLSPKGSGTCIGMRFRVARGSER
ncbi:MAG: ATP-binding protein [Nitrospirota bacterium]|jgi:signal transduction histidine kinase